jgi:serine O-acetyltransferase
VLGVDIGDQWPQRLVLPHPYAVVIHGDAAIGPDCVIYQGVTIGENGEGTGPPSLGARVKVFANATLVGPIRIGDDAVIGANSVVTKDVPDRSLAFGVPARVVRGLREDELQSGGGSA